MYINIDIVPKNLRLVCGTSSNLTQKIDILIKHLLIYYHKLSTPINNSKLYMGFTTLIVIQVLKYPSFNINTI